MRNIQNEDRSKISALISISIFFLSMSTTPHMLSVTTLTDENCQRFFGFCKSSFLFIESQMYLTIPRLDQKYNEDFRRGVLSSLRVVSCRATIFAELQKLREIREVVENISDDWILLLKYPSCLRWNCGTA